MICLRRLLSHPRPTPRGRSFWVENKREKKRKGGGGGGEGGGGKKEGFSSLSHTLYPI